jgi:hypothetical protein
MCGGKPLIIYVTQAALTMLDPPAVSDEALREPHQPHQPRASLGCSVVKDLTMCQYRKLLDQKLARAHPMPVRVKMQQVTHANPSSDDKESLSVAARVTYDITETHEADSVQQGIEEVKWAAPQAITTIEEGSEIEYEGNAVNPSSRSCNDLVGRQVGKRSLSRRILCRFPPLSWVLVKKRDKK